MGDVIELDQRQFEHIGPDDWPGELVWARKGDGDPEGAVYVGLFVVPPLTIGRGAPRAWVRVMIRRGDRVQTHDFAFRGYGLAAILLALDAVPASLFWKVCGVAAAASLGLIATLIIGWLS